jgi:hypothetical protein
MSIFKATFKPYISRQINTRQNLLKQPGSRGPELQKYVSGKSPWLKMTSLVNYQGSIDLAKKYVLMGGTLVPKPDDDTNSLFGMRAGINNSHGAYGSNLGDRQYGIVPMPGIATAEIKSKSAYGSLREATVKYYAWDKKQQDELSILFQTPGYPVILEWGWSMYLDTSVEGEEYNVTADPNSIKSAASDFNIKTTVPTTIDCFASDIKPTAVYDQLEKLRHKYSGNYDGMLGYIRNFEWQLMSGGGYECTVILISIGDVLDTLKMNSFTGNSNLSGKDKDYKDEFETLLTHYATFTTEAERHVLSDVTSIDTLIVNKGLKDVIDTDTYMLSFPFGPAYKIEAKMAGAYSINNYYMSFAQLVFIINETRNLFLDGSSGNTNQEKIINIEVPLPDIKGNRGTGLCVASKYSISIDPATCLFKNSSAAIFQSHTNRGTEAQNGFLPDVSIYGMSRRGSFNKEYLYQQSTLGTIGNIYINIGKAISLYKNEQHSNNGSVYLGAYLRAILKDISFALGSVNNFDLYVEDSTVVIIDKAYAEPPDQTGTANKFVMNMAGTDTIVRNHSIKSKIFPSQASMIAIGAGVNQNLGSVQTSTYNYMNNGLTSRLYKELTEVPNQDISGSARLEKIYTDNILKLVSVVETSILRLGTLGLEGESILGTMNTYLNTLLVKVVADTDYKAIIPISLEATMDGIGGITIGEIFTVNKDILPRQYKDRAIGFIVTGISNSITRPDWTTTLTTQICLLDQEGFRAQAEASYANVQQSVGREFMRRGASIVNDIKNFNTIIAFLQDLYRDNLRLVANSSGNGNFSILDYETEIHNGAAIQIQRQQSQLVTDDLSVILGDFNIAILNEAGLVRANDTSRIHLINKVGNLIDALDDKKTGYAKIIAKSPMLIYYANIQNDEIKRLLNTEIDNITANIHTKLVVNTFYLDISSYDSGGLFTPIKLSTVINNSRAQGEKKIYDNANLKKEGKAL